MIAVIRMMEIGRKGGSPRLPAFILCLMMILIPGLLHGPARINAALPEKLPRPPLPDKSYLSEPDPAKGRFLVASEQLNSSFFAQSVILIIDHSPKGTTGLIVNRPTRAELSRLIPELAHTSISGDLIYSGGPVGFNSLTILIRADKEPVDSSLVFKDVYFSGSMSTLTGLIKDKKGYRKFRTYAGYAGWSPGQLESEILRGSWYVMEGDGDMVFDDSPSGIWPELMRRRKLKLERIEVEGEFLWQYSEKGMVR